MPGRQIDELFYTITSRTQGFTRGISTAQTSIRGFVGRLGGATTAVIAFGAAAVAAGIKATRMAAALDSSLREVATLLPGTVDNIARLRQEVIALSTEVPETPELLSRGLYQVISAGITDTAEAMEVLRVAARAATAGITDTFTSVDAITTVLNAYQLETSEAGRVSDVLFETVRQGKVNFEQLSSTIGTVATSAALAGVSIEEVGAAIATLTKFGIDASQATVSLNRLLLSLTQVTDEQAAAAERMGIEFNVAAVQSKGLVGFLQDLQQATGGNIELLAELNPEIRSARAAFVLAGEGAAEYGRILAETNDSAGSTGEAFNTVNGSLENQAKVLRNQINEAWLDLGATILPLVLSVLEDVNRLLETDTETTIRLLRSLGRESAAATLEAREAERRLAEAIEDNNARIEASLFDRRRAFLEFQRSIGTGFGFRAGELSALDGIVERFRILPDLAGRTREEQEAILEGAIDLAEEIRTQVNLTEDQQLALVEVERLNASVLGLIQQQNRLVAEAAPPSRREQELQTEIEALRERASILSQAGESEAENVAQIRTSIALRENELALIEAQADLAEAQSEAFETSAQKAAEQARFARRAAAATTGAERERFLQQAEAFDNTERALQRVTDLETARANIGREITTELGAQTERMRELRAELAEIQSLLADPGGLLAGFDIEAQIDRANEAVERLREAFEFQQAGFPGLLEDPGADLEAFDLEARLLAAQRAIEGVTRSGATLGQQALAIEGILQQWNIEVDQLPPGFQQVVRALRDVSDEAEDTEDSLREIIQDVSFAARGAIELANALGLVSDEAAQAVNQISLIGEGIGRIASGDIVAGIGGVASGIAGVISGIVGPSQSEIERIESLRANTRRLEELTSRLDILAEVLRGLPGGLVNELGAALGPIIERFAGVDFEAGGRATELRRAAEASGDIRRALEAAGISAADIQRAASELGIEADQLLRAAEGELLDDQQIQEAIQQAESLFEALDNGLADVLDTVRGRLGLLQDAFDILDIGDPGEQLRLIAEELERAGTALSAADIERLAAGDEAFIEALFEELRSGTGRFTDIGAFGELSFDEFLDILRQMESIQDRIASGVEAEGEGFQQVSAVDRATSFQFDRALALDATRNFLLEQIRDSLEFEPVQVTDTMLAAASSVRHEFASPLVIEVRTDGPITDQQAAIIGEEAGTASARLFGIDRDLGTQLRRERAALGLPPVKTQ